MLNLRPNITIFRILLITTLSIILAACNNGKQNSGEPNHTGYNTVLINHDSITQAEERQTIFLTAQIPQAVNVGVAAFIGINFDSELDPSSISNNSFIVRDKINNNIDGTIELFNNRQLIFKPTHNWALNSRYNISVTTQLKYKSGKSVNPPKYSFATQPAYKIFEATNSPTPTRLYLECLNSDGTFNQACIGTGFTGDFKAQSGTASTGVGGADVLCNKSAQRPNDNTIYKAMIGADTVITQISNSSSIELYINRYACSSSANCGGSNSSNWVLQPNSAYYNEPGVAELEDGVHIVNPSKMIGITTGNEIFNFPLSSPFTYLSLMYSWTGLNSDWTTSGNTCGEWMSSTSDSYGITGFAFNPADWGGIIVIPQTLDSTSISDISTTCSGNPVNPAGLYCVEQPATAMVLPINNSKDIDVGTQVVIQFGYEVIPDTVNSSSFIVKPSTGGAAVTGTITGNGTTYTFIPSAPLLDNTTYTVTLTDYIVDGVGDIVPSSTFTFSTMTPPPPPPPSAPVMITPAENERYMTNIQTPIQVQFNADVNSATVNENTFLITPYTAGKITGSGKIYTFTPDIALEVSTAYTVTLTSEIQYSNGTAITTADSPFKFYFTTALEPEAPILKLPANTSHADIFTPIQVQFGANVDPASVTLSLSPNPNCGSVTGSGSVYTCTPTTALTEATVYSVTVNAKYADGYSYTSTVPTTTLTFTTVAQNSPIMISPPPQQRISAPIDTLIEVKFPANIDVNKLESSNFIIYEKELNSNFSNNTSDINVSIQKLDSNIVQIVPQQQLHAGALETLQLKNITRNDGSVLFDSFTFITKSDISYPILQQPALTTNAPVNTLASLLYPVTLDDSSLNTNNIYVTQNGNDSIVPGIVHQNPYGAYNLVTFISNTNYNFATSYTIHVQNLTHNGVPVGANTTFTFTTATSMPNLIIYEATNQGLGYSAELKGISGADNICNNDPNKPVAGTCQGACTYKALLGDSDLSHGRFGCSSYMQCGDSHNLDWVMMRNQTYVTAINHTPIWTTDNNGVVASTQKFMSQIEEPNMLNKMLDATVWSGQSVDWLTDINNIGSSCNGWTSSSRDYTVITGLATAWYLGYNVDTGAGAIDDGGWGKHCYEKHAIYCVEQPINGNIWDK